MFSNPSWKVIVSASRGQYLKPDSVESGFFLRVSHRATAPLTALLTTIMMIAMITNSCAMLQSKKSPRPGTSDRRVRKKLIQK